MSEQGLPAREGGVRRPAVAGTFYPAAAAHLARDVDALIEAAVQVDVPGRLVGLVEPHAGYMYSGGVAAAGYRQLGPGMFERVVLVGPSHCAAFPGVAVWDGAAFATPLGEIPLDREFIAALVEADPVIARRNAVHDDEHSLEVQLPFLQRRLGHFQLVPMVMGRQDPATCARLGRAIARLAGTPGAPRTATAPRAARTLLIASSDLSHYHPYDEAVALDRWALGRVEDFDPEGLLTGLRHGTCEACGGGPIAAVLIAARELGARGVEVLSYQNSGDVTGDRSQVVGYPACAIIG